MRALVFLILVLGHGVFTGFAKAYQSYVWWEIIGVERFEALSRIALYILSLSPSSASVERSFKIRSRVHSKARDRLADQKESYWG